MEQPLGSLKFELMVGLSAIGLGVVIVACPDGSYSSHSIPLCPLCPLPVCDIKQPRNYDHHLYRARHLIENFFNKPKPYRAIATRYDKRAMSFLGAILLAETIA